MTTDAIRNLITTLIDQDGPTRKHARDQLVEIGQPAASSLSPLLLDKKTYVRWEATKALSEIGDPDAVPAVQRAAGIQCGRRPASGEVFGADPLRRPGRDRS